MKKILWKASNELKNKSNLSSFQKFLKKKYNLKFDKNFLDIHKWSVQNSELFWNAIWDYSNVLGEKKSECKFNKQIFKSKFLVNSKLNFAENLLTKRDNSKAITFISENGFKEKISWKNLYNSSSKIINFLIKKKN